MSSPSESRITRLIAVQLAVLLAFGVFAAPVAAQVQNPDVQTVGQDSAVTITLDPDADGWPVRFAADIASSADLESFVVDVYVDGVLETSEQNPTAIAVEFDPTSESRFIRVDVREFGETTTCEVDSGSVQLQNINVDRVPGTDGDIPLFNEPFWTIEAESAGEVANVAAIGTFLNSVQDFEVTENAAVTVAVGADQEFETSQDLWNELATEESTLPGIGERLIVTNVAELSTSGGQIFISESEFGGRVGSVRLSAEILVSPQSNSESGFALRINDQIIETGLIEANGQATIDVVVDEADWPRDATVALDLSLIESEPPCSADRAFSGQAEFEVTPLGVPSSRLTVSDFPALLLEGTFGIFAEDDVTDHDVAVVSSALQAISAKRITFGDDAASADDALVVIERGDRGSVVVENDQLVVTLDDELVTTLQEERFWIYNDEAVIEAESVEVIPEALAFIDLDEGPLGAGGEGFSLVRIVPFVLLVILVAAVLSLLWKNSKAPSES